MAGAPAGARRPVGFTDVGIDPGGDNVFFGFKISDTEEAVFEAHHETLAAVIKYLQAIAYEARQRRHQVNPAREHTEVERARADPLHSVQFMVDAFGQCAMLVGTTKAGVPLEVQIPYALLRSIERDLPDMLAAMRARQASHKLQQ
jgi:hypothetical protein